MLDISIPTNNILVQKNAKLNGLYQYYAEIEIKVKLVDNKTLYNYYKDGYITISDDTDGELLFACIDSFTRKGLAKRVLLRSYYGSKSFYGLGDCFCDSYNKKNHKGFKPCYIYFYNNMATGKELKQDMLGSYIITHFIVPYQPYIINPNNKIVYIEDSDVEDVVDFALSDPIIYIDSNHYLRSWKTGQYGSNVISRQLYAVDLNLKKIMPDVIRIYKTTE